MGAYSAKNKGRDSVSSAIDDVAEPLGRVVFHSREKLSQVFFAFRGRSKAGYIVLQLAYSPGVSVLKSRIGRKSRRERDLRSLVAEAKQIAKHEFFERSKNRLYLRMGSIYKQASFVTCR